MAWQMLTIYTETEKETLLEYYILRIKLGPITEIEIYFLPCNAKNILYILNIFTEIKVDIS